MKFHRPLLIGIAVFVSVMVLTQIVAYQRYVIAREEDHEKALVEASLLRDRLKSSLSYSLSATNTLAFIDDRYGIGNDFDSIAKDLLESHRYIDALELTRGGMITNVYPLKGNEAAIGYDILKDSTRSKEALKAIEKKALYFAGPFDLKQGGSAVVGRLPMYKRGAFWGFSVVIIRLHTLLQAAGINQSEQFFDYQLSKINPDSGAEEFFLPGPFEPAQGKAISVDVPDGEWILYVKPKHPSATPANVLPFAVLGLFLSLTAGGFAWYSAHQPEALNRLVNIKTAQVTNLNRLYHLSSRMNQMIVRLENEREVFQEVCKIAVETGGFKMAWLGIINEQSQKLNAVASAGDSNGYVNEITPIDLGKSSFHGPMVRILQTHELVCCNDIANDELMKPWSQKALLKGFRSSVLLPVKKFGKVIGSFNLYLTEVNAIDEKEINLLRGLTNDISFSLEHIAQKKLLMDTVAQLQHEKVLSDSIINSLPGVFYLYDSNGKFMRWNENFEKVSGYSGSEIFNMRPTDFFDGEEKILITKKINEVFETGYAEIKANFFTKDKSKYTYYFNGLKVFFNDVAYLIGMGIDITHQINTERELYERAEEIQKLTDYLQHVREEERTNISREIHDVLGQQLTGLKMDSSWLRKHFDGNAEATGRINDMILLIDDTIKTVRRISMQLRPGILDDLGLIAALDWQMSDFEKRTGIKSTFTSAVNDLALSEKLATNIFRIFQESLTNVARHANATEVNSSLIIVNDTIELMIRDNGIGIEVERIIKANSLGIVGMKERARMFNGELSFHKDANGGTIVRLVMPIINTPAPYEVSDF